MTLLNLLRSIPAVDAWWHREYSRIYTVGRKQGRDDRDFNRKKLISHWDHEFQMIQMERDVYKQQAKEFYDKVKKLHDRKNTL